MPELQAALKSKPSTIAAHNQVNFKKQFPERLRDTRVGANQKYNMAKKDPYKYKSGNKAEQVNSYTILHLKYYSLQLKNNFEGYCSKVSIKHPVLGNDLI